MSIKSKKKERITTPAYGHPSLKGGELMLTFLLVLFLNLPHLFAQSPNYHIGDVITNPDGSKGVVFWLAPDGSGGWMCALNDVSGTYQWSTQSVNISDFPALPTPTTYTWQAYATVTADTAGYEHTQRLRAAGNASTYPAAYAVDFAHGWYLPAIGQLLKLYAQQATISAALAANGGSEISLTNHYWSSTYATTSNAYFLRNPKGYWADASKSIASYVRPVRSFSAYAMVYDTTLTYQWSTGDTTANITVSPDTTTTYQVVVTNETGCSDTVDFTLYVNSPISQSITETTCGSYEWHGQTYTESGTYTYAHEDTHGCQQVDTLHLTIISPDTVRFNETVCQGEPYTGHGFNIPADSTMTPHVIVETRHATSLQTGCDSTIILTLTVHALTSETLNVTVIENDLPYMLNGMSYDTAGTYVHRLTNAAGCDSTLTLNLTVHLNQTTYLDSAICADELPLTWNGVTFNAAGTQNIIHTAHTGADSTVVMTLHVNAPTSETLTVTILESDLPYILNGTSYDTAGTFVQHLTNAAGCDSILTLNLTVHLNQTTYLDSTVCADELPLTWNGVTFNAAGTQNIIHTAHTGADSTVVMTLTVHALTTETLNITVIETNLPYFLNGTSYSDDGTYVQHLTNAAGCDSTLTLNLTVYRNVTAAVDSSICADQLPFTWNGVTFNEAGTRTVTLIAHNGIDSVLTMTLHVNPMPRITANLTNINCHGDSTGSIAASAVQGTPPYSYQWTREQAVVGTSATITDLATGTYHLHVSDAHGCEADSSFTLVSLFAHTHDTVAAIVCQGEPFDEMGFHIPTDSTMVPRIIVETVYTPSLQTGCDSVVTLLLTVNPAYHFNEELTLCDYDLPFTFRGTVIEPGVPAISTIDFSYNTVNGCDSIFTLDLMVVETDLKIVSSTDFCEEAQTELMAQTDLENYRWSTGEETSQIHISAPGNYSVTAATGSCEATALINIPECELNLYLPNAITPGNVDGLNDYFSIDPYTQKFIGEFEIWIYDRWGELVFYSADKNFKWNGEVGGELYPNTMYSYRIRYTKKIGKWFVEKGVVIVM